MKKILTVALAAAMTLTMGAVAVSADAAPADSMNVSYYKAPDAIAFIGGEGTLVEDAYGAYAGYNNLKQFDATIDNLLKGSFLMSTEENVTSVAVGNTDNYIYKWTGTMTAKEAGTYTLIARKIDNGFVMKVDGKKVFEYWGASHWFDGADDRLVSDLGTFTLAKDQTVNVELYYLELGGGDALEVWATTTPNDTNSGSNINDAFTFNLKKENYSGDRAGWANVTVGEGNRGPGAQVEEANQKFDKAFLSKLEAWTKDGENDMPTTVSTFAEAVKGADAYVVKYTGSLTPAESGKYVFGATKIDNGFYLEIDGKPVYEFWAGYAWNDDGSGNVDTTGIELEAGKAYNFTAYFLETDGGEALEIKYAVNAAADVKAADMAAIEDGFVFSTEILSAPEETTDASTTTKAPETGDSNDNTNTSPVTGDSMVYALLVVAAMGVGTVVAINKKRKISE